jgi:NADPH2:quinone reductase
MIPSSHRVLLLRRFGEPSWFAVVERPVPEPKFGEVLVKVLAASVQSTDVILRKGLYPTLDEEPPLVLGCDLVGEIVKIGEGVNGLALGQRICDLTITGAYAQYCILNPERIVRVDSDLDPAEATSLVLTWVTAYQLLHRDAHVKEGQKLLVLGAAGAVGQALITLGLLAGCEVWGAARRAHEIVVQALGATFIDSDKTDLSQVRSRGFDAVFDGVAQQGFSRAWRTVGPGGHLSAYGFSEAARRSTSRAMIALWFAKLWFWDVFAIGRTASFYSITAMRERYPDFFSTDLNALLAMLLHKQIKPRIAGRISLDSIAKAHAMLELGGLEGKIILAPNG